ncbi:MAG: methyltransferase domain-containing protein [Proteobacteria bacterium]|nr:methyltransferase domain-containing protein [Pseudomonadota bacterium]
MNRNHSSESIMALGRGFMESRILLTAAELDLFTLLGPEPLSVEDLADRTGLQSRPTGMLLDAMAALGFLLKMGEKFQTPPDLAPLLRSDSPTSVRPMLLHSATLWWTWSQLTSIVNETGGPVRPASDSRPPDDLKAFIGAMAAVGASMASEIARSADAGSARSLLDVGGATGTYTLAFLALNPRLQGTIFDLPPVIDMARERLETSEFRDRVTLRAGDFYRDDLPTGHDLVLLSAVIHQNSLEQNLDLYRKVFQALDPGGRILIRDHVMSPDRTSPPSGALFAINMLVNTAGGGTYTLDEITTGLEAAGFSRVRLIQSGNRMDGLVEAFKP